MVFRLEDNCDGGKRTSIITKIGLLLFQCEWEDRYDNGEEKIVLMSISK